MLIARALLKKDANIFLIDEATSNLDPWTEQAFLKNFSI
jgi:ABC-type bacteriocin/lantibiotic exporter with double-glycine peptidase domain